MQTAADSERRLREIYGEPGRAPAESTTESTAARRRASLLSGELGSHGGVLHVTAVARTDRGPQLETIAIRPGAPRSPTDFFLLNVARARADAIVTTGKILRDEPDVEHRLQGPDGMAGALEAWRRERARRLEPALSVILTRSSALDFEHPLFRSASRALVVTEPAVASALASRAERSGVEVVALPALDLRSTVEFLQNERGCRTIAIEAGPSTTRDLYAEPMAVDEIMLSLYEGPRLAPELCAGPFLDEAAIDARFARSSDTGVVHEESGRWSFRRYRRERPATKISSR